MGFSQFTANDNTMFTFIEIQTNKCNYIYRFRSICMPINAV